MDTTRQTTPEISAPAATSAPGRVGRPPAANRPPGWAGQANVASPSRLLAPMAPSGAFLATNALAGLIPAMIAASLISGVLVVLRRRQGRQLGYFLPLALAYVTIRAVAGVVTESHEVFFGFGLVLSGTFAMAVLASAVSMSPAAAYVMPFIAHYERTTVAHPIYLRVARQVTIGWAMCEMTVTGWKAWHLRTVSAEEFVGLHALVGWPVKAFVIFWLVFYIRFRLDPLERYLSDVRPIGQTRRNVSEAA